MESQGTMPKKFFSNDKICKYCKVHMVRIFWADDILKNTLKSYQVHYTYSI